jgi:hypothetical protein
MQLPVRPRVATRTTRAACRDLPRTDRRATSLFPATCMARQTTEPPYLQDSGIAERGAAHHFRVFFRASFCLFSHSDDARTRRAESLATPFIALIARAIPPMVVVHQKRTYTKLQRSRSRIIPWKLPIRRCGRSCSCGLGGRCGFRSGPGRPCRRCTPSSSTRLSRYRKLGGSRIRSADLYPLQSSAGLRYWPAQPPCG